MVARVLGRFRQLLDRELGRGQIGVAEAEVDDVLAGPAQLEREVADRREDVRRQAVDAAELHGSSLASGSGRDGGGQGGSEARSDGDHLADDDERRRFEAGSALGEVGERARDGFLVGEGAA